MLQAGLPTQKRDLEQKIWLGFGLALLLLGVIGAFSYRSTVQFLETSEAAVKSRETLEEMSKLLIDLLNAETGQRGYILTGEARYLEPYYTAVNEIDRHRKSLRGLLRGDVRQQERLNALESLVSQRLDDLRQRVRLRQEKGFEVAASAVRQGQEKELMDEIRRSLGEMEGEGYVLLERRNQATREDATRTLVVIVAGGLLALFLIPLAAILIKRDIANRRLLEEELRKRNSLVESINKELEAFSYSVSHDLRSPLRHIDGFTQLLQKGIGSSLEPKNLRYLNIISDSVKQMGRLIDDLLVFSRMGRNEMQKTVVDMGRMVNDVINEMKPDVQGRNVIWNVMKLPEIKGDPGMLKLVWANLIGNAIKYTKLKAEAQIEIGTMNGKADEIVFFVRDNGAGFDMQYVEKLFGVFQRLHSAEEFEGTGIGLANVKRIILRHGGRAWAQGKVNEGASIFFSLPTGC